MSFYFQYISISETITIRVSVFLFENHYLHYPNKVIAKSVLYFFTRVLFNFILNRFAYNDYYGI